MTPERWQQVKRLIADALELPPTERAAFLDRECGADRELRREVQAYLDASEHDSFRPVRFDGDGPEAMRNGEGAEEALERAMLQKAVAGQYEVLRRLGRGGMGSVYLARYTRLDLPVAIKVLRAELAADPKNRRHFEREARTAAGFKHANIIRLDRYEEVGGLCFFVMRYVPGGSLADRLRNDGAVAVDEARAILEQLADAVDCAHSHGVIHRDIKPANILFDDDGRPMLADFGIAKIEGVDTFTPADEVRGTPPYMSPEQLQGLVNIDGRTDQYSLGLVGYAMIVGRESFDDTPIAEVLARRLSEDAVPLQTLVPSVPPELAAIIMRCLERDRARRFPDARALKQALKDAARTEADPVPAPVRRDLLGFGQYALVWALLWTIYALRGDHGPREQALTLLIAFLVPLGFALNLWNVSGHGLARRDLVRISYWPPEWWGMWWPAVLRRPTDLWSRLPWQARAVRIVLSAFFVGMPALVMAQSALPAPSAKLTAAENGFLLVTALTMVAGVAWAHLRTLSFSEGTRMLVGATLAGSAWEVPSLARMLLPIRGVRAPEANNPMDYVRAIGDLLGLWGSNAPPIAHEGLPIARALLRSIESADRTIASLDRDARPGDIERLLGRIEDLVARPDAHGSALLEVRRRELDVLRAMRRERDDIAHERQQSFDRRRSLWTFLCRRHEESVGGPPAPPGSENVLFLYEQLVRRAETRGSDPAAEVPGGASPDGSTPGGAVQIPRGSGVRDDGVRSRTAS